MSEAAAKDLSLASRPPLIESLVGIRGIAATWVLIEHFRLVFYGLFPAFERLDWWVAGANLGIEIFFPLSGFIISYMYADRLRAGASYADFMLKRFARIYPVYLVTFLAVAALVGAASVAHVNLNSSAAYTPLSFIGNILVLQDLPGIPAWNPPAWSISVEMLAYLTFPLTAWLLARLTRTRSAWFAALAWLIAGTGVMMAVRLIDPSWTSLEMALLRITTEFVGGALLWKAWSLAGEPRSIRWDVLACGTVVFTILALAFLPHRSSSSLVLTPFMAILIIACAGARGPVAWVLSTRLIIFGGKISYSLYMVHFVVFALISKALRWEPYEHSSLPVRLGLLAFYFLVSFALAAACYYIVEEPARRAIQRVVTARRAKREAKATSDAAAEPVLDNEARS